MAILNFFRSSTPIINRINEEPTKAPTIDLFDMLNTSDYREEKYVHIFLIIIGFRCLNTHFCLMQV